LKKYGMRMWGGFIWIGWVGSSDNDPLSSIKEG
jgi:hypothetical protein